MTTLIHSKEFVDSTVGSKSDGKKFGRFRFKKLSERLNDVDLDIARRIASVPQPRYAQDSALDTVLLPSNMFDTLEKQRDLDLTSQFVIFYRTIIPQCATLPQVVHNQDELVRFHHQALLSIVSPKESEEKAETGVVSNQVGVERISVGSMLVSLAALSQDLLGLFLPHFRSTFEVLFLVLDYADAIKDIKLIEQTFVCIAFILKHLLRPLSKEMDMVESVFTPLLSHKRSYMRRFSAEIFSIFLRKKNPKEIAERIIILIHSCGCTCSTKDTVRVSKSVNDLVDGVGMTITFIMKGVRGQFFSKSQEVLSTLFNILLRDFPCVCVQALSFGLSNLLDFVDPEQYEVLVWSKIRSSLIESKSANFEKKRWKGILLLINEIFKNSSSDRAEFLNLERKFEMIRSIIEKVGDLSDGDLLPSILELIRSFLGFVSSRFGEFAGEMAVSLLRSTISDAATLGLLSESSLFKYLSIESDKTSFCLRPSDIDSLVEHISSLATIDEESSIDVLNGIIVTARRNFAISGEESACFHLFVLFLGRHNPEKRNLLRLAQIMLNAREIEEKASASLAELFFVYTSREDFFKHGNLHSSGAVLMALSRLSSQNTKNMKLIGVIQERVILFLDGLSSSTSFSTGESEERYSCDELGYFFFGCSVLFYSLTTSEADVSKWLHRDGLMFFSSYLTKWSHKLRLGALSMTALATRDSPDILRLIQMMIAIETAPLDPTLVRERTGRMKAIEDWVYSAGKLSEEIVGILFNFCIGQLSVPFSIQWGNIVSLIVMLSRRHDNMVMKGLLGYLTNSLALLLVKGRTENEDDFEALSYIFDSTNTCPCEYDLGYVGSIAANSVRCPFSILEKSQVSENIEKSGNILSYVLKSLESISTEKGRVDEEVIYEMMQEFIEFITSHVSYSNPPLYYPSVNSSSVEHKQGSGKATKAVLLNILRSFFRVIVRMIELHEENALFMTKHENIIKWLLLSKDTQIQKYALHALVILNRSELESYSEIIQSMISPKERSRAMSLFPLSLDSEVGIGDTQIRKFKRKRTSGDIFDYASAASSDLVVIAPKSREAVIGAVLRILAPHVIVVNRRLKVVPKSIQTRQTNSIGHYVAQLPSNEVQLFVNLLLGIPISRIRHDSTLVIEERSKLSVVILETILFLAKLYKEKLGLSLELLIETSISMGNETESYMKRVVGVLSRISSLFVVILAHQREESEGSSEIWVKSEMKIMELAEYVLKQAQEHSLIEKIGVEYNGDQQLRYLFDFVVSICSSGFSRYILPFLSEIIYSLEDLSISMFHKGVPTDIVTFFSTIDPSMLVGYEVVVVSTLQNVVAMDRTLTSDILSLVQNLTNQLVVTSAGISALMKFYLSLLRRNTGRSLLRRLISDNNPEQERDTTLTEILSVFSEFIMDVGAKEYTKEVASGEDTLKFINSTVVHLLRSIPLLLEFDSMDFLLGCLELWVSLDKVFSYSFSLYSELLMAVITYLGIDLKWKEREGLSPKPILTATSLDGSIFVLTRDEGVQVLSSAAKEKNSVLFVTNFCLAMMQNPTYLSDNRCRENATACLIALHKGQNSSESISSIIPKHAMKFLRRVLRHDTGSEIVTNSALVLYRDLRRAGIGFIPVDIEDATPDLYNILGEEWFDRITSVEMAKKLVAVRKVFDVASTFSFQEKDISNILIPLIKGIGVRAAGRITVATKTTRINLRKLMAEVSDTLPVLVKRVGWRYQVSFIMGILGSISFKNRETNERTYSERKVRRYKSSSGRNLDEVGALRVRYLTESIRVLRETEMKEDKGFRKIITKRILPQLFDIFEATVKATSSEKELNIMKKGQLKVAQSIITLLRNMNLISLGYFENITGILASALKSRRQVMRNLARETLVEVAKDSGTESFSRIVVELRSRLRMTDAGGFEGHVLTYTVHSMLVGVIASQNTSQEGEEANIGSPCIPNGSLDYALPSILPVLLADIVGSLGEAKDVSQFARKYKESSKESSPHSFELIASVVKFDPNIMSIISPLLLLFAEEESLAKRKLQRIRIVLDRISQGLARNTSLSIRSACIFVFKLLSELSFIVDEEKERKDGEGVVLKRELIYSPTKVFKGKYSVMDAHKHIFVEFSLKILLKEITKAKNRITDDEYVILDGLIEYLVTLLSSIAATGIVSSILRILTILIPFAKSMPSIGGQAQNLGQTIQELVERLPEVDSNRRSSTSNITIGRVDSEELAIVAIRCYSTLLRILADFNPPEDAVAFFLNRANGSVERSLSTLSNVTSVAHIEIIRCFLERKTMTPELYDVMDAVLKRVLQVRFENIRNRLAAILVLFITEYPMSKVRLRNYFHFISNNMSFDLKEGRIALLNIAYKLVSKCPSEVLNEYTDILLMNLAVAIGNEEEEDVGDLSGGNVISRFGEVLRLILSKCKRDKCERYLYQCLDWLSDDGSDEDERTKLVSMSSMLLHLVFSTEDSTDIPISKKIIRKVFAELSSSLLSVYLDSDASFDDFDLTSHVITFAPGKLIRGGSGDIINCQFQITRLLYSLLKYVVANDFHQLLDEPSFHFCLDFATLFLTHASAHISHLSVMVLTLYLTAVLDILMAENYAEGPKWAFHIFRVRETYFHTIVTRTMARFDPQFYPNFKTDVYSGMEWWITNSERVGRRIYLFSVLAAILVKLNINSSCTPEDISLEPSKELDRVLDYVLYQVRNSRRTLEYFIPFFFRLIDIVSIQGLREENLSTIVEIIYRINEEVSRERERSRQVKLKPIDNVAKTLLPSKSNEVEDVIGADEAIRTLFRTLKRIIGESHFDRIHSSIRDLLIKKRLERRAEAKQTKTQNLETTESENPRRKRRHNAKHDTMGERRRHTSDKI